MTRALLVALLALASCNGEPEYIYPEPPDCPLEGGLAYLPPVQPRVMLLVDRSSSMGDQGDCAAGACPSKWEQIMAMTAYLGDIEQSSMLGLTVFPAPDAGQCTVDGGILVPISEADDADEQVLAAISSLQPGGKTPVAAALDLLAEEAHLQDPHRDNVVVLLTDGRPNCNAYSSEGSAEDQAVQAVERLVELDEPVELFVIGFGTSAADADETLSAMARAAGATTGPDNYYRANTVEELLDRLYRVAASLDACAFVLEEPVGAGELVVFANGQEVAPCTEAGCVEGYGYDQDAGVVQLAPETCRSLGGEECPSVRFETR